MAIANMSNLLFQLMRFGSRVFGKISRILNGLSSNFGPKDIQKSMVRGSTRYDMVNAPDERYYAVQYWQVISRHIHHLPPSASCLDLGCSQGRLTLKLARQFSQGKIIGCDISEDALATAAYCAQEQGLTNVDLRSQSISHCLSTFNGSDVIDVVLMTEVTFFYPQWRQDLPRIVQLLKPGGILAMSFRSQYFDALCLARQRLWENAEMLLDERQGRVFGGIIEFSWQQSSEIRDLFSARNHLNLLDLVGIGCCSGIPGDPHDQICQPSRIGKKEQDKLMRLELALGRSVPDAGRYILAIGEK